MIETDNEFIYTLVPEIVDKNLGKDGLIAAVIFGSYAEHEWDPSGDIDMDLIFNAPLNVNHALTVAADIKKQFANNKLTLDIRVCADRQGNGIYLHNENKQLRYPDVGKIDVKKLYYHPYVIRPNGFDL